MRAPIFVLGCGHSGTTLLRELVGAHSRIYKTPDEVKLFRLPAEEREAVIADWDRECLERGCCRWLDKMAAYVYNVTEILERFPEAPILVMIRDGRDVALSLRKRWQDFERATARWIADNEAMRPFLGHPNVKLVRYEDLVRSPRETLCPVFGFLGEKYEEDVLRFWQRNRAERPIDHELGLQLYLSPDQHEFRVLRQWQIQQPIYDGSGRWQDELTPEERDYFKQHASALLTEFGYAADDRW